MQSQPSIAQSDIEDKVLQPTAAQMRCLMEQFPTAIAMVDRNLHYLGTNGQWREYFNLSELILSGQSIHHLDVFGNLVEAAHHCVTTAAPARHQTARSISNNRVEEWAWKISPWYCHAESVGGAIISVERQVKSCESPAENKHEIEATRHRLELILQQMPIAVVEWNQNFQVVGWNPAAEKLFGYEPHEIIGQSIARLIPDHQKDVVGQVATALITPSAQSEFVTTSINQNLTKTGQVITCEWHNTRLVNGTGEFMGIVSMAVDVSDRIQTEAKVKEQEQFLRSIYDGVNCSMFVIDVTEDGDFRYNSYNHIAEQWTGKTTAEIAGLTPEERFGEEEGTNVRAAFQRCVDLGEPLTEEEHLTFRGREVWLMSTFNPLFDSTGRIHRIVGTVFDITSLKQTQSALQVSLQASELQSRELEQALHELKQAQAQLVQNEKMSSLGQLVAGVAHEINNPVNFIYGNLKHANTYTEELLELIGLYQKHYPQPATEILQRSNEIDVEFLISDLPNLLNSMKVGADRIQKIVASLRTFSRMDEAEMKAVNIHDGIDSTLMILQSRLKGKDNRPTTTVIREYGDLPLVECYAGQLNQVFMNILSNAIEALEDITPDTRLKDGSKFSPTITIRTQQIDHTWIQIGISDNGTGVPAHLQQRLFDPFFTTKPVGKGTGMGLSISYQIVTEKHGGKLYCQSEPGQGTEFIVQIPRHQPGS